MTARAHEMAEARIWRVSDLGRVGAGVFVVAGALFGGWGIAEGIDEGQFLAGIALAAMGLGASFLAYRCGFYSSLQADSRGLIVRNPFSTATIPWNEFRQAEPGYMGIVISKSDGSRAIAWVVQKSNWAMAKGTLTRADEVISEIAAMAEGETGAPRSEFELDESQRTQVQQSKRKYLMVAVPLLMGSFILRLVLDSLN